MNGLRLNLGCGAKKLSGFVNVDKFGEPDLKYDLEVFPWPWDNNSVVEILLNHVLEPWPGPERFPGDHEPDVSRVPGRGADHDRRSASPARLLSVS
jgi:hypothetical protein